MITDATRDDAALFHYEHCDAENRMDLDHVCQGTVTINASTCSFDCARCGHDRVNIAQQVSRIREAGYHAKCDMEAFDAMLKARQPT